MTSDLVPSQFPSQPFATTAGGNVKHCRPPLVFELASKLTAVQTDRNVTRSDTIIALDETSTTDFLTVYSHLSALPPSVAGFIFPLFDCILPLINTSAPTYREFYKNLDCVTAAAWLRCLKTVQIHSKSLSIIIQTYISSSAVWIYLQCLFFCLFFCLSRAPKNTEERETNHKMFKTASSERAHSNSSLCVCIL